MLGILIHSYFLHDLLLLQPSTSLLKLQGVLEEDFAKHQYHGQK